MSCANANVRDRSLLVVILFGAMTFFLGAGMARAGAFDHYELVEAFALPAGAGPFEVLGDGRIITLVDDQVYIESALGSRRFEIHGTLPAADLPSFGAAFVRISPDGTRLAVGNNGGSTFANYKVGVFNTGDLNGAWFTAAHFDAAWIDDRYCALTAGTFGDPSVVTALDTASPDPGSPVNPVIVGNIAGASAGVTLDPAARLYTGNGFSFGGPSGTGAVKAFDAAAWGSALSGGSPPDFETDGTLIVDVLSAAALGFDADGNLFTGGGDIPPDTDAVALVRASAVAAALQGQGPADPQDPLEVRYLDPITSRDDNFYSTVYNSVTGELYLRDFGDATVHVYHPAAAVPAVHPIGLALLGLVLSAAGSVLIHRRRRLP